MNWLHRLLNPHCPDCNLVKQEEKVCKNCDTLRSLLEIEKFEKKRLLDEILRKDEPIIQQEVKFEEIKPKHVPWRVKQQTLEENDRIKAKILADRAKIEKMEKELQLDKLVPTEEEKSNAV